LSRHPKDIHWLEPISTLADDLLELHYNMSAHPKDIRWLEPIVTLPNDLLELHRNMSQTKEHHENEATANSSDDHAELPIRKDVTESEVYVDSRTTTLIVTNIHVQQSP